MATMLRSPDEGGTIDAGSDAGAAASSSQTERLIAAVVSIKQSQPHLNLTAPQVRSKLRGKAQWSDVSERAVRKALTEANKHLGAGGVAAYTTTWRCCIDDWTQEQLERLRSLGHNAEHVSKFALDTTACNGTQLRAVFTFKAHLRARSLCGNVLDAPWWPSSDAEFAHMYSCRASALDVCSSCARRVLAVCSSCARHVLVVCSMCARRVLVVCSSCARRVLDVCSTCARRRSLRTARSQSQARRLLLLVAPILE